MPKHLSETILWDSVSVCLYCGEKIGEVKAIWYHFTSLNMICMEEENLNIPWQEAHKAAPRYADQPIEIIIADE